jgi:hypothetical protein
VNLRFSHLIGVVGVWLFLSGTPASAQVLTLGSRGFQELQFVGGPESSTCSTNNAFTEDNIVWGTSSSKPGKSKSRTADAGTSCATSLSDDNIVWGTLFEDNIVWGTTFQDDNIVWGTTFLDDNIVWGTTFLDDNIVWGTSIADDNIVWGTSAAQAAHDF